jgi:hypothetical protein
MVYTVRKTTRDAGPKHVLYVTENSVILIDSAARSTWMTDFSDRSMWMTEFSVTYML